MIAEIFVAVFEVDVEAFGRLIRPEIRQAFGLEGGKMWVETSCLVHQLLTENNDWRPSSSLQCKRVRAEKRKPRGRYRGGDHGVLATPDRLTRGIT